MTATTAFNAEYYATVATVVPILMLAVTFASFQGFGFSRLVKRVRGANRALSLPAILIIGAVEISFVGALIAEVAAVDAILNRANHTNLENTLMLVMVALLMGLCAVGAAIRVMDESLDAVKEDAEEAEQSVGADDPTEADHATEADATDDPAKEAAEESVITLVPPV